MKRIQPSNFSLFSKEIQERIQKILVNIMPLFFVDKFCDCLTGLPGGGSSRRHGADDWRQSSQKAPTIGRKRGKNCGSNNPFSK